MRWFASPRASFVHARQNNPCQWLMIHKTFPCMMFLILLANRHMGDSAFVALLSETAFCRESWRSSARQRVTLACKSEAPCQPREEPLLGFWVPVSAKGVPSYGAKKIPFKASGTGRLGWTLLSRGQPYNVALAHVVADFDSLAAAVGLAKLWHLQDPSVPSCVVLPDGAHPSVSEFLALHLELFPIFGLELLDTAGARKVGVCDAQTRDRVGPGAELLEQAESVHIFDHHIDKDSDIPNATIHIERVGAVTTMVTEMLREECSKAGIRLSEAESTLLALGIHADTGSLTYDSATARDAEALAWLMTQGCQQTVVSEYTHTSLSAGQQSALVQAIGLLRKRQHNGISVGSVLLFNDERVAGMARVAQNLLDMSEVGVLLVGEVHPSKPGRAKDRLALIGRARARIEAIDLNVLFQRFGAGGHPKAAAASVRLSGDDPQRQARKLLDELVDTICNDQILEPELVAEDFMTSPVLSCPPNATLSQARSTPCATISMCALDSFNDTGIEEHGTHYSILISRGSQGRPLSGVFMSPLTFSCIFLPRLKKSCEGIAYTPSRWWAETRTRPTGS
ncbi:unnamed protein product [Ascophyllum nodosum]